MRWLLTVPAELDLDRLRGAVEAAGGATEPLDPVPLDGGEQVLYAEGPDGFGPQLEASELPVKAHPDSEQQAY